jgi:hypothetical protein
LSFRTNLLKSVQRLLALPGPTGFDVYTMKVTIRVRTWDGGEVRVGDSTDVDTEILPRPKVIESGVGATATVGPVVPSNALGGYTPAMLNPTLTAGQELLYVLEGPAGTRNYTLVDIDTQKAFSYYLTLQSLDRVVPY